MPAVVVIGLLLVLAACVAGILWLTGGSNDTDGIATPGASTAPAASATTAPPPAPGPVTITSVTAWDPDGDNGSENDEQATLALADGNEATGWATECYSSQYLGGKRGVGLVVALSGSATGRVDVTAMNAPYQLQVMASDAETAPTDLDQWGQPLDGTAYAEEPGVVSVDVASPARFVLVWLKQLGPDGACSEANPYRGRLGELTFTPS